MNFENYFLKEKLSDGCYLIYNAIRHIPIKVDKEGLNFFETILKSKNEKELDNNIAESKKKEFRQFRNHLKRIKFLSIDEIPIDSKNINPQFNATEKTFYLHLTNKCNLKCNYCFNKNQRINTKELNIDEWKRILTKILPFTHTIILTGGEATLYPNIREIIKFIKENKKIHLELSSNASLDFEKKGLTDVLKLVDNINFSCDNIENDDHERIGFNKNIFLKNIELLNKLGIRDRLSVMSVLLRGQSDSISKTKKFCDKNDIAARLTIFIPETKGEKEKMPLLKEYVNCMQKYNKKTDTEDTSIQYRTITCGAARNTFSIDAQGNVFPCQSFHFSEFILGNILQDEFEDIYNSNTATMLRISNNVNYKKKCQDCNVKYICAGGCVANTYSIEKGLLEHPETLCPIYKTFSMKRLKRVLF